MNLVNYFKQIEENLNEEIKCFFNCHQNILIVEEYFGIHLKRVRNQRILVEYWLNSKGYVNKEELSKIAMTIISIEEKVDALDDLVFNITKNWSSNKQSLKSVNEILNEIKSLIEEEYTEENQLKAGVNKNN